MLAARRAIHGTTSTPPAGYALVGTIGAPVQGANSGAVGSSQGLAWGAGESRTASNLLICWCSVANIATLPATPTGWSIAHQLAGTSCSSTIYYLLAAGSDAVPTINAITGGIISVQLAEFSDNATTSPLDQHGGATTTPFTATATGTDTASGELVILANSGFYSAAATKTLSSSLNNGATAVIKTNNSVSSKAHFCFGYGITTSNSSADSATNSFTAGASGVSASIASFKHA
jgi:hypothetical protein